MPKLDLPGALAQLGGSAAGKRRSAARALAGIGDRAACAPLGSALRREVQIPRAWEGPKEMAIALRRCGCVDQAPLLAGVMVGDYDGTTRNTAMADAFVSLATSDRRDVSAVREAVGHGLHHVSLGAFNAMARMGLLADDEDVAWFLEQAIIQQIDLGWSDPKYFGSNVHLDLRYPLVQAARHWSGPATDALLDSAAALNVPYLVAMVNGARRGELVGMTVP